MNICSVTFVLFIACTAILYHALPRQALRQACLSAANLAFLISWMPHYRSPAGIWSWLALGAFLGGTYLAIKAIKSHPATYWVCLTIGSVLAAFLIVKRYEFLKGLLPASVWEHPIELIGISYMLFKFIHVFVDQWQGQLQPISFTSYANYQLGFFTLLAGPIQRYNEFYGFWQGTNSAAISQRDSLLGWNRLLTGILKMGIIAPLAWHFFERGGAVVEGDTRLLERLIVNFYAYPIYLYFNFSGYTDAVIGSAQLLGCRLPENFNYPFLARNVLDFWNRWHITLSHWIRDYVFMTSYKAAAQRLPHLTKPLGFVLMFTSLLVAGIWHGSTAGFAWFGAIHGLGAAANQMQADRLKAWLGREGYKRYLRSKTVQCLAILLTFHFVCFSFLCFSGRFDREVEILRLLNSQHTWTAELASLVSAKAAVLGLVLLPVFLLALWYHESWPTLANRWLERLSRTTVRLYGLIFVESVVVTCMFFCFWAWQQTSPVLVYMKF
jgi:alginate O-acetyltransferase complex protein AlgI